MEAPARTMATSADAPVDLPAKIPVLTVRQLRNLLARLKCNAKHPLFAEALRVRNEARSNKLHRRLRRKVELGHAGAF